MRIALPLSAALLSVLAWPREAASHEYPAWAKELPEKAVEAKVGDKVWATVPSGMGEMVNVRVYTVSAIDGNTATLTDKIGDKVEKVPGALIHPLLDRSSVKEGDAVHGHAWHLPNIICRITKLGKKATMKHWWFKAVKEEELDEFEPLRTGVEPMAFVSYPDGDKTMQGFCVAIDGERAWIYGGVASVTIVETTKCKPLPIGAKDFQVGDRVLAYQFPWGYRPGTVEAVVEPGLAYRIQVDEEERMMNEEPEDYFFSDVIPAE